VWLRAEDLLFPRGPKGFFKGDPGERATCSGDTMVLEQGCPFTTTTFFLPLQGGETPFGLIWGHTV